MVKDEEKITKRWNKIVSSTAGSINIQLSNDNRPKALTKVSSLSLVTNATANTSDVESVAESKTTEFDKDKDNLIAVFLTSEVEEC